MVHTAAKVSTTARRASRLTAHRTRAGAARYARYAFQCVAQCSGNTPPTRYGDRGSGSTHHVMESGAGDEGGYVRTSVQMYRRREAGSRLKDAGGEEEEVVVVVGCWCWLAWRASVVGSEDEKLPPLLLLPLGAAAAVAAAALESSPSAADPWLCDGPASSSASLSAGRWPKRSGDLVSFKKIFFFSVSFPPNPDFLLRRGSVDIYVRFLGRPVR